MHREGQATQLCVLLCLGMLQINDFSMVAFVPMNINREESIETVLMHVDHAINYGDDLEPQVRFAAPDVPWWLFINQIGSSQIFSC